MPGINGKELADLLCENHPERKVLFMSGYTESIIAHRGIIDDSIQFIQKPFTQAEMAEKIQHLLGIGN
jgi:FixJ family two-component response regulator